MPPSSVQPASPMLAAVPPSKTSARATVISIGAGFITVMTPSTLKFASETFSSTVTVHS